MHWRRLTHPLFWLLLASIAIGILRALTVPIGNYNIDESIHLELILNIRDNLRDCIQQKTCVESGFGITQFDLPDPYRGAIYYWPQGIVQSLLPESATEIDRVLVARLFTLIYIPAVIILTYLTLQELFPANKPLAIFTAGVAAFIPSFSDMMSGVNLDVPAAFIGSLTLFVLARITRRGPTAPHIFALLIAIALGYTSKGTVWPLLVPVVIVIWLRLPTVFRYVALGAALLIVSMLGFIFLPLARPGTAYWFYEHYLHTTISPLPAQNDRYSVLGKHSLQATTQIDTDFHPVGTSVVQYIPERFVQILRGKIVTCGGWMRAQKESLWVAAPKCGTQNDISTGEQFYGLIQVATQWQFIATKIYVPNDTQHLGLFLGIPSTGGTILYDGMIIAEGNYLLSEIPHLEIDARKGIWGDKSFVNLLENPSAEYVWVQAPPDFGFPYLLNNRLVAIFAWQRTLPAWFDLIKWLLANFWSSFGGLLPGLTSRQMIPLALVTTLVSGGVIITMARDLPRYLPPFDNHTSRVGFIMLTATAIVYALFLLYRADLIPYEANMIVWSSARHASPARIALSSMITFGLLKWIPVQWHNTAVALSLLALFLLNTYIFLQVQYPFQHCTLPVVTDCLSSIR